VAAHPAVFVTLTAPSFGPVHARPVRTHTCADRSRCGTHPERLIHACWALGADPAYTSLRRWAHMLGFGGHFLTKARRYSVRFAGPASPYRRGQDTGPDHGPIRAGRSSRTPPRR
jgi:hypothetical protein